MSSNSARGRKRPFEHQRELRALMLFDRRHPGYASFLVQDDGSVPHLREGEYAIVDLRDREPQHGEIYLIEFRGFSRNRYLKQIQSDMLNITGPGAEPSPVWWLSDLRGFRKTNEVVHGVPLFAGLSDGPYTTEDVQSYILGRIVGYALKPLGELIAPKGEQQGGVS